MVLVISSWLRPLHKLMISIRLSFDAVGWLLGVQVSTGKQVLSPRQSQGNPQAFKAHSH